MSRIEEIKKRLESLKECGPNVVGSYLDKFSIARFYDEDVEWLLNEVDRWKNSHAYLNAKLSSANIREDSLISDIILLEKKLQKSIEQRNEVLEFYTKEYYYDGVGLENEIKAYNEELEQVGK